MRLQATLLLEGSEADGAFKRPRLLERSDSIRILQCVEMQQRIRIGHVSRRAVDRRAGLFVELK